MANLIFVVLEIWALSGLIFLLHAMSVRYGLTPLIVLVGTLIGLLRFAASMAVYINLTESLKFTIAGNVVVPAVLLAVFIIYLTEGTVAARTTIFSIIGVEVFSYLFIIALQWHLRRPSGGNLGGFAPDDVILNPDLRTFIASTVAFMVDLYAIAIIYQWLRNRVIPYWAAAGVTLFATMMLNVMVFWSLGSTNFQEFIDFIPGSLIGGAVSSVLLWIPLSIYMQRVIINMPSFQTLENRPAFEILFGTYSRIERELARSTAELETVRSQYEHLTDQMNDAFWISDPENKRILYVSKTFETLWGLDRESIYRDPDLWINMVHEDDRSRVFAALRSQADGSFDEEFRIQVKDDIRWVRARAFPVPDEQGNVNRVVGIAMDISHQKALEEHKFELVAAQRKVSTLRNFISEASHDMRNPLSAINMKLYLLEKEKDSHKRQQYMNDVQRQTIQLAALVDDMLTLSRLESTTTSEWELVDLRELLLDAITIASVAAEAKRIKILPEVGSTGVTVRGISLELRRAFSNLIDNGVRYNKDGGNLYVRLSRGSGSVVFQIEDTGIGIEEAHLADIFERFYRTSAARQVEANGTGLGLAITRAIIERHNGTITVVSTPGAGTIFTVTLPVGESNGH
ncbi:MAG: ATP-binding protein [Chloroflexi bacterium]|nr:ATP-binding protein [Chloroflexota bacterium]